MRTISLFAILALLLAACSGGGTPGPAASAGGSAAPSAAATTAADIDLTGPVTITLWHALTGGPQKVALEAAVAKFNETNGKGITVKAEVQGNYTVLDQKVRAAITAGTLPDLVHAYESSVADYTKADVVVDLDPYVNSKKNGLTKESQADIYKSYYDTNRFPQFGNKLLSWPFTKSLAVMYVNDDMLKAAGITAVPKTWSEFEAAVAATTKKDASGKATQWGFSFNTDASYFDAQVYARGGSLMAPDNKTVAWDGKEGVAVAQMYDKFLKDGSGYTPKGYDFQDFFVQGKLAFFFSSTSSLPFVKSAADKTGVHWSIADLPQADQAKAKTVQFGGNIAVLKSTPEKQLAAWLFLKWFSDTEQTADWAVKSYYMPVRKSAASAQALKDFWAKIPQAKQGFDLIGISAPEPNVRGQQEIRPVISDALTAVLTGKATPDAAIKDAGKKANQILKDNQ